MPDEDSGLDSQAMICLVAFLAKMLAFQNKNSC